MQPKKFTWQLIPILLVILSLACSFGSFGLEPAPTATPLPTPYPTPSEPLPPALVEINPPPGSQVALQQKFTLYFNQPMVRASVEVALTGLPMNFNWLDDATLEVQATQPLEPNTSFTLQLDTKAAAGNGLYMQTPVEMDYQTADALRVMQLLPEPDTGDVQPTSAVVVAFNQPVVALGADPATLPEAFTINPPAEGSGEWLNTSTYAFYPEPGLDGGTNYTVSLNTGLKANTDAPLQADSTSWSFSTSLPRLLTYEPTTDFIGLDGKITLIFNQPMDTVSVETAFTFSGPDGKVNGQTSWESNDTKLVFTPNQMLRRNSRYTASVSSQAKGRGGSGLEPFELGFMTYPNLAITGTDPADGALKSQYGSITVNFSAPLPDGDYFDYVSISPEVSDFYVYLSGDLSLGMYGYFQPQTSYTVTISGNVKDKWGQTLGNTYRFTFSTPQASPTVQMPWLDGTGVYYIDPDVPNFYISATNVAYVDVGRGTVPVQELIALVTGNLDRRSYYPDNLTTWRISLNQAANTSEPEALPLDPNGQSVPSGIYYFYVQPPSGTEGIYQGWDLAFMVASHVNLVLKIGPTESLVWAMDTRTNQPVASAPVTLYDQNGQALVSGSTNSKGLWQADVSADIGDYYQYYYAVMGNPGDDTFGMAISGWESGISNWTYNIASDQRPAHVKTYLYTDRPIYRPGQVVYFRGVIKQLFDGRYMPFEGQTFSMELRSDYGGAPLQTFNLPVSEFGTIHGEYALDGNLPPGSYYFYSEGYDIYTYFQVAEYRKPEVDLSVTFSPEEAKSGDSLTAQVSAQYYFGAPVSNKAITWTLYTVDSYFDLPGYHVGSRYAYWMGNSYSNVIDSGEDMVDAHGLLNLTFDNLPEITDTTTLKLSVTIQDASNQYISTEAETLLHPSDMYIGLRADVWAGQAGTAIGFDVYTVDWGTRPIPNKPLSADFSRVTWERDESGAYNPAFTSVASGSISTDKDGKGRITFTPDKPGTYVLTATDEGASSQVMVWIGGKESASWPNRSTVKLDLTADKDEYLPGETASVFIPNPFGVTAPALITVERGTVHKTETVQVDAGGSLYSLSLTDEDAPNVYLSITLLHDRDFRQGYVTISVKPVAETLNVTLTALPDQASPRDEVRFTVQVTDANGRPVQGEFSLAVVDKAVLALADPNAPDILPALYDTQPLAIQTGLSLAADIRRATYFSGGKGGGGGDGMGAMSVRTEFPDTAYWNPTIVTDANGIAQVSITLPDSLTTWNVDLRGLTEDTRVGQADTEVVTSKSLLIRPVTPRFFVVGDHVEVAAIIHNNTDKELDVNVALQATGFKLDDTAAVANKIKIPANDLKRVSWWGTIEDIDQAGFVFTANAGELTDQILASGGGIPILHYSAPQRFVTAGVVQAAGTQLEVVSMPRSFDPVGGGLTVELSPSLASVILDGLDVMEPPTQSSSNEYLLSYLLSNLDTYRILKDAGLSAPQLQSRLQDYLPGVIRNLVNNQDYTGGWAWYQGGQTDTYLTAYVLFGLDRARQSGFDVNDYVFERARDYLNGNRPNPDSLQSETWEWDRLAFIAYVLQEVDWADVPMTSSLLNNSERLSPWAQALFTLTLEAQSPGSDAAQTLLSNLQGSALRSASGAFWESESRNWRNPGTPLFTTAVVTYALAQRDPASPLLVDATRYLASQRDASGWWYSSYESTWVTMALAEVMRGSGDYAANFAFDARLNGAPMVSGQASGPDALTTISGNVPAISLVPDGPNSLTINHQTGSGKLYYRAILDVYFPINIAPAINRGLEIGRDYIDAACEKDCASISDISLASGDQITARLTLNVPHDSYYVVVEDYIPAGAEILNLSLKTAQQYGAKGPEVSEYNPDSPFGQGWGWWWFDQAKIFDDHISWTAEYLPAGTYVLTYTLVPQQAGTYQVIPALAWLNFFPDVQGRSAGEVFEIKP